MDEEDEKTVPEVSLLFKALISTSDPHARFGGGLVIAVVVAIIIIVVVVVVVDIAVIIAVVVVVVVVSLLGRGVGVSTTRFPSTTDAMLVALHSPC
jgi:hypothetical protein